MLSVFDTHSLLISSYSLLEGSSRLCCSIIIVNLIKMICATCLCIIPANYLYCSSVNVRVTTHEHHVRGISVALINYAGIILRIANRTKRIENHAGIIGKKNIVDN